MRVLHVIPTYLPAVRYGGPIWSTHGLCKALVALGHHVHVCTTSMDGPGDLNVSLLEPVTIDGVSVNYFGSPALRRMSFSPSMARWLWHNVQAYDVLHIHSMFSWPTLCAAIAARRFGVPYVLAPRGSLVPELIRRRSASLKQLWLALFDKRNIRGASLVHATTAAEAEHLKSFGWQLPEITVVPNGADIDEPGGKADGSTVLSAEPILYLGRLSWEKGLDRLLSALVHVPDAHLIIAGNDESDYSSVLRTLAAQCGVTSRVTLLGPVYGEAKRRVIRDCALVVLPSYSENFGNVVLEAWAHSRAVIVTPEVGLADAVRSSGAGVVASGEPEKLGAAIQTLLADTDRRTMMGLTGKALIEREYSWHSVAVRMERCYRSCVAAKKCQ